MKSLRLSWQFPWQLSWQPSSFLPLLYLLTIGTQEILLTGCTTNFSLQNYLTLGDSVSLVPPAGTSSDTSGAFALARVLKNGTNPTGLMDFIGDGSGTLGSLCSPTGSSSEGSACTCTYAYSTSTQPNQKIEIPVSYTESDLVRCPYTSVPKDATSLKASIHVTTSDIYSNTVTIQLSKASSSTLDLTLPASYVQPIRYQCRQLVTIFNPFSGNIYDPYQSEDFTSDFANPPKLSLTYPLDFYATNLAIALNAFSSNSAGNSALAYWSCPSILDYRTYLSKQDADDYETQNRLNLKIYSSAALTTTPALSLPDSKLIYPITPSMSPSPQPSGSDRNTFYLAREESGLFNIPVDAYIAPGIITSESSTTTPSLGYGANPIPLKEGGETCPSASLQKIPTGYHWVKVWLFRASLDQRTYLTPGSNSTRNKLTDIGAVACNPGDFLQAPSKPVYDSCPLSGPTQLLPVSSAAGPPVPLSLSLTSLANPDSLVSAGGKHFLADRVLLGSGQCVRLDNSNDSTLNGMVFSVSGSHPAPNSTPSLPQSGPLGCLTSATAAGAACPSSSTIGDGIDRWLTWYINPTNVNNTDAEKVLYPNYSTLGCGAPNFYQSDPLSLCGDVNDEGTPVAYRFSRMSSVSLTPKSSNSTTTVSLVYANPSPTPASQGTANPVSPISDKKAAAAFDTGASRYDYLFVVTPPTVMVQDMYNQNSKARQYWPYRFKTKEDCNSTDPDNPDVVVAPTPTPTSTAIPLRYYDCQASQKITYSLKLHGVGTPEDPSGTSTYRSGDFPVCALQPDP